MKLYRIYYFIDNFGYTDYIDIEGETIDNALDAFNYEYDLPIDFIYCLSDEL